MASPAEIVERWERKVRPVANDDGREPDGYIRVSGKPMAVFLPKGETAASLSLRTFSPSRRWGSP